MEYIREPQEIYKLSFATVEAEAELSRFSPAQRPFVVRLIHACGMLDIVDDLVFSNSAVELGHAALAQGAPVICDTKMVQHGVTQRLLPADNQVMCALGQDDARAHAKAMKTTQSAGAMQAQRDQIEGAVVAIGNAPTALFHLLEGLQSGWAKPAIILGFPVGFVGAVESKAALIANSTGVPFIALRGRRGGSALAAAAVNALAAGLGT